MAVKIKKQVLSDWSTSGDDSLYDLFVALRTELDDLRTQYAVVRTLVNELKTDHNATDAAANAGAAQTAAASAAALAAATFEAE